MLWIYLVDLETSTVLLLQGDPENHQKNIQGASDDPPPAPPPGVVPLSQRRGQSVKWIQFQ